MKKVLIGLTLPAIASNLQVMTAQSLNSSSAQAVTAGLFFFQVPPR